MKFIISLFALLFSTTIYAEDTVMPGKQLHDGACMQCHGSEVYTREDRRVTSLAGLNSQVARCEHNLGISWFDDERESVVKFLNHNYYKFK